MPKWWEPTTATSPTKTTTVSCASTTIPARNIILNDNWDYYVPYAFTTSHVDNSRTLTPRAGLTSSKYTTFLPYGQPTPDGATAYLLTKREGTTLVFKQVYGMEPLTPYLVVTGAHDVSLTTDQEQQIPTYQQAIAAIGQSQINVSHYSLRGTTTTINNQTAAGMGAFIMQADNLWHRVKKTEGYTAAYIPPYRAFILESAGPTGINTLSMELIDDADGIDSILTIDHDGTERWYDLNGRELPGKPQHGIYIHNGKKHAK